MYCKGDETHIGQCLHNGFGVSNCDHDEDVGIVCHAPTNSTGLEVTCQNRRSKAFYLILLFRCASEVHQWRRAAACKYV